MSYCHHIVRILICDDHAIFRSGLVQALEGLGADLVEASGAEEALRIVGEQDIDIVLLDLDMPGVDGWAGLRAFRSKHAAIAVVIVSASQEPADVRRALDRGASGFIPKSSSVRLLRGALEVVLSGSVYVPPMALPLTGEAQDSSDGKQTRRQQRAETLTPRQLEVLNLMSRGLTNKEIGDVLHIAESTVKAHIGAILEALDVTNRTEAALVMRELGLEPSESE